LKKLLSNLTAACLLTSLPCDLVHAQEVSDPVMRELLTLDLTTLGIQVYTASRMPTSINMAPAVVTVITQDEIEDRG
jgi:outer membrane cobalamin receptor